MSTLNTPLPYFYTAAAAPKARAVIRQGGSLSLLALVAGLLLLTSHAPDLGVVPATEILPLNDTQVDLSLSEIVARFEEHLGTDNKNEAYRLGKLVLELSERHQLSPSVILSVVEAESSYRFTVVSKAGAVGLMQLLPETAAEIAALYHIRSYKSAEDLNNPAVNLRLGVAYLTYLRHKFGNSLHYLAAYNLGPTALRKRLQNGRFELGSLDPYVRSIHGRARMLSAGHTSAKQPRLLREEALLAASL
ncbi:MAG: lytic transglycosylase domain-containing protein [Bdellovibrionota bacterium]